MTWLPGRAELEGFLAKNELETVTPDLVVADRLIATASLHLESAALLKDAGDLTGAYQVAYDAMRKSSAALLAAQGLRATTSGGHVVVQDAVSAQFGNTSQAFRSFRRIRQARNRFEYPDAGTAGATTDDVDDAIATATKVRDAARTILQQDVLTPW
jgi:uncharacterized protein (UPF0332 family)